MEVGSKHFNRLLVSLNQISLEKNSKNIAGRGFCFVHPVNDYFQWWLSPLLMLQSFYIAEYRQGEPKKSDCYCSRFFAEFALLKNSI
jgi:hypothetical protein